ncbi:PEPxxWA-CTERM sorting domain-containing protein [Phenylobacterium sp.]|uniref:PEPxxWA-CTERM sorting domain-containing protein n=1 Tax=Phenylobacterium sp. TaxID=1871053 RepID=UPI002ED931BA
MHVRLTGLALAIGLAAGGGPASAATVTGTFTPAGPGEAFLALLQPAGSGIYEVSFAFSRPGAGHISTHLMESYEFYDAVTGEHQGGDDNLYDNEYFFPSPTLNGSLTFRIGRPYSEVIGGQRIEGFFWDARIGLSGAFDGATPVTYSLSVDRVADVPEPAAWLLMIGGFGLAGTILRRRARAVA